MRFFPEGPGDRLGICDKKKANRTSDSELGEETCTNANQSG